MPSILIITPNFKLSKASRTTKVVNDWVFGLASQGHDVFLHHVRVKYLFFDFLPSFIRNFIISNLDYTPPENLDFISSDNNFSYSYIFLNRTMPKIKLGKKNKSKLVNSLPKKKFDYVVLHWHNPTIHVIKFLNNYYGNLNIVLHDFSSLSSLMKINSNKVRFFSRNKSLMMNYEKFGIKPFGLIHSSINSKFFFNQKIKTDVKKNILTVTSLIKRKNIKSIVSSIKKSEWVLNVIGEGPEKFNLKEYAEDNNCNVKFHGLKNVEFIINMMDSSSIFILSSKGEAYGLVYLEAMSRGMITVSLKGEGMDDIIINGKNGFLLESGDDIEIYKMLEYIFKLDQLIISSISKSAIITSKRFNQKSISKDYIRNLLEA